MMIKFSVYLLISLSLAMNACESARRVDLTSGEVTGGEINPEGPVESLKPALKRKDYRQFSADLSSALELESDELCNELGSFPCLEFVHRLALGGIAPETQSIYSPTQFSSVTAPIALERVVYAACGLRINKDFQNPANAKIFKLTLDQNNNLSNPTDPEVQEVVNTLFRRAFLREANEAELQGLQELYNEIAAAPNAQLSGPAWAWGSCLAIFTSAEFIFY
jgi:hypothetical protein